MTDEYLLFKWGSLKGWNLGDNEIAKAAAQRWHEGGVSMSAMSQRDTADQKQALCELIDAINGPIQNDWTGEQMTKDAAKAYVLGYGRD